MPFNVQYQQQNMPAWLEDLYRAIGTRSRDISLAPHAAYPHARLAPESPHMRRANELAAQEGLSMPYLNQAERFAQQGAEQFNAPGVAAAYMNPYLQQVVNRIGEEGGRHFREQTMPELEHAFVGHGAHGSTRHRDLALRAARENANQVMAAQQQAMHQGYESAGKFHAADRSRALDAARNMEQIGLQRTLGHAEDINALNASGERTQAHGQQALDLAHSDWENARMYPQQRLAEHVGTLSHVQAPVHQYNAQQVPGRPQLNRAGQLGNMAAALYGMRMQTGAGGGRGGYKKGGSIKKASKGFPQLPKLPKAKKLGAQSLTQSSLIRQPKVGGRHSMKKGMF